MCVCVCVCECVCKSVCVCMCMYVSVCFWRASEGEWRAAVDDAGRVNHNTEIHVRHPHTQRSRRFRSRCLPLEQTSLFFFSTPQAAISFKIYTLYARLNRMFHYAEENEVGWFEMG